MTLRNNLVAYWRLDGNSTDPVGSFNGTDTSVTYNASNGIIIQGAGFNGSSSKIQISTSSTSPMRQASALSYSFWVKIPASGFAYIGVATSGGHGSGGLSIGQTGSNNLTWTWTPTTPNADRTYTGTATITAATWVHIAFTISFTGTPSAQFYFNGSTVTTTISTADVTNGVPRTAYNTTNGDCIGARYVNVFNYGNASFDEVGIWSRRLTADEVTLLYNGGQGFQWPFAHKSQHLFF